MLKINRSLLICTLALFSCEIESIEGKWDPMKWETGVAHVKNEIEVPKSGGSYIFRCKNYTSFWLSSLEEDGAYIEPDSTASYAEGSWSLVKIQKNVMTVTLFPNENNRSRKVIVYPTAGDTGSYFIFNQKGNED